MHFRTTLQQSGKTATGIGVPADVVERLGSGKRPAVRVTLNGHPYRSTVAPMGGTFMLPVSAQIREQAGVKAGDEVEVELELDTEPREVTVPPDLLQALTQDQAARQHFERLSYSNKQQMVLSVEEAKTAETRLRRIAKAVSLLRKGSA